MPGIVLYNKGMGLSVGIIGLPNAGKSTLFNALLGRAQAQVAAYEFTTLEPNTGILEVPDENLDKLAELLDPDEVRPATIKMVDIAGLVKGAHEGQGLGNQFLSHIRETTALLHVVDAFSGAESFTDDIEIVHTELILKDFETVTRKRQEVRKKQRGKKQSPHEIFFANALAKLEVALGEGTLARQAGLTSEEARAIEELHLLTIKPEVIVVNVSEEVLLEDRAVELSWAPEDTRAVVVCAKLEADLVDLSEEERQEYLSEMRLPDTSLEKVVAEAYGLLDLITFYTIKGGEIVQAWPIKRGSTMIEAAREIHTDFADNFIVAETISVQELLNVGSRKAAREKGKIRVAGREEVVSDRMVVEIKT